MPPKDMDPGQVIDLGKARYQQFLVQLQEWLRAKKGRLRGATLIVAQVNVATFVNGSVVNVPRTIAFLNAGKSVDKQWLKFFAQENIGVPLLQATPGSGTKEKGHAEAAAAGLRQDQEGQQELLGGQMQDVPTVISGTKLCSVECSDDLNVFLNHKDETGQGDWGVVFERYRVRQI